MKLEILLENGKYSGAFYLAGYSVELYLKAKICEVFGTPDLFAKTNKLEEGIGTVRTAVKTHNLFVLLTFSGLKTKYNQLSDEQPKIFKNASYIMKNWSEEERYKANEPLNHKKIENSLKI